MSFKLFIVGDRYESNSTCITVEELEKIKRNQFIEFLGHSDNVCQIMNECHCLVLPSYREGLSKVLIEAGSVGLPVITTKVPDVMMLSLMALTDFLLNHMTLQS